MIPRLTRLFAVLPVLIATGFAFVVITASPAQADGCYTWGRTLSEGMSGEDVHQLQIRVSGYPGFGAVLALDGAFGPATRSAVVRFQQAWGPATAVIAALRNAVGRLQALRTELKGGEVAPR